MVVTEVKIKLVSRSDSRADDKLLAFASITVDNCFVVRDIKIIQGSRALFIAMPSRKITDRCGKCSSKNHLQAQYCNQCGAKLAKNRSRQNGRGRVKLHADIAHPINVKCRNELQAAVLKGYKEELERSRQPGYVPAAFDDDAGPEYDAPLVTPIQGLPAVIVEPLEALKDGKVTADKAKSSGKSGKPDANGFGILG